VKTIFLNICAFLKHRDNEFFNLYKYSNNVLTGMFIILMLLFCQQGYSVIEGECDKDDDKIECKQSALKSIFFDHIINAYSSWHHGNNVKTAIMGSTGINILNGDSCLNDIKDIDIIVNDKKGAENLILYLNKEIQNAIYCMTDERLRDMAVTAYRRIMDHSAISDQTPKCGKITIFGTDSHEPFASVDIVVKDFSEDDLMSAACEYYFQSGCNIEGKEKASIPVLTPLSYAKMDCSSIKMGIEYFKKDEGDVGVTLVDPLKEVLYVCQNLHKIKKRFTFYNKFKRTVIDDIKIVDAIDEVSCSYDDLLKEINKKTDVVQMIHKKAFEFDYSLGESRGSQHLLTHADWEEVLGEDFFICDNTSGFAGFPYSLAKIINDNCILKERFLNTFKKAKIKGIDAEADSVTKELVEALVNDWVDRTKRTLLNKKYFESGLASPLCNVDHCGIDINELELSDLPREIEQFFSFESPIYAFVLAIGIPVIVFSPEHGKEKVSASVLSPENAKNKWPVMMKILGSADLLVAGSTMFKNVIFIACSGNISYYLCVIKKAKEKKMSPLLKAEEVLLDKDAPKLGDYKEELSGKVISDLPTMDAVTNPCPFDEKSTEENNCDEYIKLVNNCVDMCLGKNNEVVNNTKEKQEISIERRVGGCHPVLKINKDGNGQSHINLSNILRKIWLSIDIDTYAKTEVGMLVRAMTGLSLDKWSSDDVSESKAPSGQKTGCKQKTEDASNTNKVNKAMKIVFGTVSTQCKQTQRIIIDLNKCGDVLRQLNYADDFDCPLAPLIIGVYKMTKLGNKGIGANDIVDIIKCFIKAAISGNIQGVACLYWLAEMTGSPEAFSLSISLSAILNKYFSDEIVPLHFVWPQKGHNCLAKSYNMSLPLLIGRWSSQKNYFDTCKVLSEAYPRYNESGDDSSAWGLDQSASVMDSISYKTNLAFFYLYSCDKEKAFINFREAAFSYAWLIGKTDDISMISKITKAAGWASIYQIIHCDKLSTEEDIYALRLCLGKESNMYNFLCVLKGGICNENIPPAECFENKINYFYCRRNEGIVLKNSDELEYELIERNGFFDCNVFKRHKCDDTIGRVRLDPPGIDLERNINKYKKSTSKKSVGKTRVVKRLKHRDLYKLFLGGERVAKMIQVDSRIPEDKKLLYVFIQSIIYYGEESFAYLGDMNILLRDNQSFGDLHEAIDHKIRVMFKDIVCQFSTRDMLENIKDKDLGYVFCLLYNLLGSLMAPITSFVVREKHDHSIMEKSLELASRVFNKSVENIDIYSKDLMLDTVLFKFYCLKLLNPMNYENINTDMQAKLIKSLLVNMGIFVKDLGVDMNKVDGSKVDVKKNVSEGMIELLGSIIDHVDNREFFLLVIEIFCKVIVVDANEDLLSKALLNYFISVENEVASVNREAAYMEAYEHLRYAVDKGRMGTELYDVWESWMIEPYLRAREKDAKDKEDHINSLANSLIEKEESEKSEIKRKRKHKAKQNAVSRMLKGNVCSAAKDDEEHLGAELFIKYRGDCLLPLKSVEENDGGSEENKRLIFLYNEIVNEDFGGAFKGFCDLEADERVKLCGADDLYLARINILKFECLVESVKYGCQDFKYLYNQSKTTAAYLSKFKVAAKSDRLPKCVSAEQLKAAYTKLLPIILVFKENNSRLEQAVTCAKNAANILQGLDGDSACELELLLLQQDQLKEKIVNLGEACQNISDILVIRKDVLGSIRGKDTADGVGAMVTTIDAKLLLENCKMAVECADRLKENLSDVDVLNGRVNSAH